MMGYMLSIADFQNFFKSVGQAFGDIISFLRQIVEAAVDFLKWLPYLASFTSSMTRFIIPEFVVIAVVVVTIYVIKIIVGGDNK